MKPVHINLGRSDVVIFAADIHIKASWSAKLDDVIGDAQHGLDELVRVIAEQNAKLIILGGDVFDRNVIKEAALITIFQNFVKRAQAMECAVAAYPGNHDRVYSLTGEAVRQWYEVAPGVLDVNNAVFTFGERTAYAMGFCDVPADAAAAMLTIPEGVDTLFLHQNIRGVGLPTYNFDEDLVPAGIDEIYVGDIHMPIQGSARHGAIWAYPGPMFPQEFGEDKCGVLVFTGKKPTRGVASWKRATLTCRPTRVVDATLLGPSDDLLVDRIVADTVAWATAQASVLQPVVNIKLLSSARQHVAKLKAGIIAGAKVRVAVTYVPPVAVAAVIQNKNQGVPPPDELIAPYFETLKTADGRFLTLRRPNEALALLKALFELKPGDETVKGRENAYRAVVKSHLDALA